MPNPLPAPGYAELHCLSNFSFQRGASTAKELFERAGRLGYRALAITDYRAKRARFDQANPSLRVRKGIGLATFMHGAGFTGSGEDHLASVVAIEAAADGRVRVTQEGFPVLDAVVADLAA